jgi:hypothetical protein
MHGHARHRLTLKVERRARGGKVEAHIHAVSVGARLAGCVLDSGRHERMCLHKQAGTWRRQPRHVGSVREGRACDSGTHGADTAVIDDAMLKLADGRAQMGHAAMHADRHSACMRRECVQHSRATWACSLPTQSWLLAHRPMQQHPFPASAVECA